MTIRCEESEKFLPPGEYKLTKVEGDDCYDMSTVTDMTITYDVDPLIEGSELSPVIDKDHRTFAINFNLEKNFEIFLDQEGKEKLNCYTISIENTIECKPTEEQCQKLNSTKFTIKAHVIS